MAQGHFGDTSGTLGESRWRQEARHDRCLGPDGGVGFGKGQSQCPSLHINVKIDLSLRHEKRLADLADKTGKPEAAIVAEILEDALFPLPPDSTTGAMSEASVGFHESKTDLDALVREQGVRPVARFEDLLGDFWPVDESVDDFLAARQDWSHEGRGVMPAE